MPLILHPDARARIEMLVEPNLSMEPPHQQASAAAESVSLENETDQRAA
jgi:hypothetical protein